jgi:hypothetical protein
MRASTRSGRRAAALAAALATALLAAGCTQTPGTPPEQGLVAFRVPRINLTVGSDPVATAVASAAFHLSDPQSRLVRQPAVAAQVAGQYEFATEALREPRFLGLSPLTQPQMARGRIALREVIGIAADAPPRLAMAQLSALAGALDRGDLVAAQAILEAASFIRPGREVLETLGAMPPVPEAARAASFADQQLSRTVPATD